MKKIMFNDSYGLTEAVMIGRKTQTRRLVPNDTPIGNWSETVKKSRYQVGDVVAIAQSYKDCGNYHVSRGHAGWTNKMFVLADLMPHHIRITNVRMERLQNISDEDCIKEGVREVYVNNNWGNSASHWEFQVLYEDKLGRTKLLRGATQKETYAAL